MFKLIHHYFRGRWERYYLKSHWHLVLDLSMTIVIIILAAVLIGISIYHPGVFWKDYTRPVVDLNNPPLSLSFSLTKSGLKLPAPADLQISYANEGSAAVNHLTIDFQPVGEDFSLDKIELASGTPLVTGQGRELTGTTLAASQTGQIAMRAYFTAKNPNDRTINWQAQISYIYNGQLISVVKDLPTVNISAQLSARSDAYYTSPQGDQLGIGPLPPIVGIPTEYWIFWSASSTGDFRNVVLNARLPQGVELGMGRSLLAGDFSYSTSTRQLIWKVGAVNGYSDSYRLGFAVRITPAASQVGKVLPLLEGLQYYGVDGLTGEISSGQLPGLDTNLASDRFNAGEGKVINQ